MSAEVGRLAAYADLVTAVLDLRSPEAGKAFDEALSAAVESGVLPDDVARQLRWLQRQSERALIEHAETVLPPALVALQRSTVPPDASTATVPSVPAAEDQPASGPPPSRDTPGPLGAAHPDHREEQDRHDGVADPEPAPVVQLQARRLLVAGLRPLPDPAHRGTLPS